jgi:hypothetical protein
MGKSAASFWLSAARWQHGFQICFATFILVKNNKNIAITQQKHRKKIEKISPDFESLEFDKIFYACLTKFENKHILLNKISYRFLLKTK